MSDPETPDPQPEPAPAPPPEHPEGSPYRNLWVPLVVVPFLVVGVLVLVFLFFGAIRGRDATLRENLARVVEGGTNERKQAALSLVAQVIENHERERAGREPRFDPGPDFLGELQRAWEATEGDDNLRIRLALARVLVLEGDPGAREKLEQLLRVPDAEDEDATVRFGAMEALGMLGDARAAPAVIPFLDHADPYLQLAAAAALQAMPGERSVEALRGVLGDPSLELRGMAAISLSHLEDPSGAAVLIDLVDPETYAAIHRENPRKYADGELVQNNRIRAVQALARLDRAEDRPLLERIAAEDPDPAVREAAMRAVRE